MKKYIAGWVLSNHGGVGVIELNDETMTVQYYNDEPEEVEIQFENEEKAEEIEEWADYSRQYVMVGELKLYLDECIRY